MLNTLVGEMFLIVFLLIESNDSLDTELLENWSVFIGMVTISLILISLLDRTHKGHEFSRYNPVEIAVFDSLKMLVLLNVESLEVIPAKLQGILQALKAL